MAQREQSRLLTTVAVVQGIFYLGTGIWPLVSMTTFQMVTGPKEDPWLVRTVGLLVAVAGFVFLLAAYRRRLTAEVAVLAIGNALCLTAIDVTYVSLNVIPPIYLLDAVAELLLVGGWLVGLWLQHPRAGSHQRQTG